jgi:hypothetical protein
MMQVWENQKWDHHEMESIIQECLNKLDNYHDQLNSVPAYVVSMCRFIRLISSLAALMNHNYQ